MYLKMGIQFQARNAKVTDVREKRTNEVLPKLKKLKIMPWSHSKKATLLSTAIYPAMLYGCEFHDMGLHFISHIRSQANGAVWKDKPYLSHFLTPILSTKPMYEPWLWILQRVFQSFRRLACMMPDQTARWWNLAVARPPNKHTLGPITIILAHLRRLGWTVSDGFACRTQDGTTFSLTRISAWQFKQLVTVAWQDWLVPKLKIKHGLHDLTSFDVSASCWECDDAQRQGFMAMVRSGGLFTNKTKSRMFSQASPDCSLCGASDGMTHRVYDCPASENIRARNGWHNLRDLPRSCMIYGLFSRPQAQDDYQNALDQLEIRDICYVPETENPIHIFTDGSCSQPPASRKAERRAAYGVRMAESQSHEGKCLASGTLPGRKQTAFRAELYAVVVALSCSLNSIVYTDCKGVYTGFLRLMREGWCELSWIAAPDADLWKGAWDILQVDGRRFSIEWTKAHRELASVGNFTEMWKAYHNNLVDRHASVDNNPLPDYIKLHWDKLVRENDEQQRLKDSVARYLQEIWAKHSEKESAGKALEG